LVKIDFVLLGIQLATFGFAVFLLWRLFWKPLAKFMRDRREGIEHDLAEAQRSRTESEAMYAQMKERMSEIDERAAAAIAVAEEEGRKSRAEIIRDAQAEAKRLLEGASRQIVEEKVKAIGELRAETVNLAALMAEKALGQSLDSKVQQRLVDDFAKELDRG
jgi:F-type H+-transporting ATPase subunit b